MSAWDGATRLIVFYTTASCAVMIFLAKEVLTELKGEIFLALVRNLGDYGCYRGNDRGRCSSLASSLRGCRWIRL